MAEELDDMLLEAAGRSKGIHGDSKAGSSRRLPNKSRNQDLSSDDQSDSRSDNEYDDDDDYERRGSGRKGDGSKMPLKKRFESSDKDGEDGDRDGYESELSFGSDLYKDEDDRNRLLAMTELEREMILHDRAEMRDNYKMRRRAGQRIQQMQAKTTKARDRDMGPPSRVRSSVREREASRTTKEGSFGMALGELVALRNKSQDPDLHRKTRDAGALAAKERDRQSAARRHSESDLDLDSEDDDESSRDDDRSDREASDEDDRRKDEPADVEDIKSITIRRSKLAKWFMEPFFEEVIVGCYVRIGIGMSSSGQSIYRVCSVKNVDARDPEKQYKFENRQTCKYLNCVWGDENSAARWQMVRASDQPASEKEILDMEREVQRCGGQRLTKNEALKKKEAIAKVSTFIYNAATVKQMLQEKKMATARPSNIALEKDRITKELGVAESKGDPGEVERLQARLKELEEFSSQVNKSKDAKALALAEMNRKNRFENFKNASEIKPVNTDAKAGEAGYDPFSRRWTRSQNYYKTEAPKVTKEGETEEGTEANAEKKEIAPPEQPVGIRVPAAEGTTKSLAIHDFNLQIDLAPLQQIGMTSTQGAHMAYMARKQKLEAQWGAQIDGNDGRRHTLTLTVNDYKRRRGLL